MGESDEGLLETTRLARARGIRTLFKPHLWVRGGGWLGRVEVSSEQDWRRWLQSYEAFILHYGRLAAREGMDGLAVGTELPNASRRTRDWRLLIARVREVYSRPLTYCANWHEAEAVRLLRVDAGADVATIRTAWAPIAPAAHRSRAAQRPGSRMRPRV